MKTTRILALASLLLVFVSVGCTDKSKEAEEQRPMKGPLGRAGGPGAAPPPTLPTKLPPKGDSAGPQAGAPKAVE